MNADAEARARVTERIAAVRQRFVGALGGRVESLCALAGEAGSADRVAASAAFDTLRLGLHNLAGGAPTLGLKTLGREAAGIEKRLIAARGSGGGLSDADAATFAVEIARLSKAVD